MVKITPSGVIRHDGKEYKANQEYDVDEGLATYFRLNGWLVDSEATDTNAEVTLDVHDITQDSEVK